MGIKDKLREKAEQETKHKIKRSLKMKLIPIVAGALAIVIILMSFYAITMTVENKLIELRSNMTTAVTGFWEKIIQSITDDYWLKLDEEVEFSYLDEETRRRNYNKSYFSG